MAEIVNLRSFRKRRDRAGRDTAAAENRVLHGRTRAEKAAAAAAAARREALLDGAKREE